MNSKMLHNMKDTPFNERESFNNAILLLSMVKSEYYYIVGFSRPKNQIEIGFDFEDKIYGRFSETVIMDFSSNSSGIKVFAQLTNIIFEGKKIIPFTCKEAFKIDEGFIKYEADFKKDAVIPVSIEKLNMMILMAKKDIQEFLNLGFEYYLKHKRQQNF